MLTATRTTVELVYASGAGTVEIMREGATVTAYVLGMNTGADFDAIVGVARDIGIFGPPELIERYDDGAEGWVIYAA